MTTRETTLLLTFGLLAVYSVHAGATGNNGGYRVDVFQNQEVRTTAIAGAESRSTAAAMVGPVVSGGGTAAASVNGVSGGTGGSASVSGVTGGSATVNISGTGRRTQEVRTVGIAPDISANATAPCRIALGAGGGWIGGALSIFGSVLDEGCEARSDAAMLMMIGKPEAAVKRLCARPELARALGCEVEAPAVEVGAH